MPAVSHPLVAQAQEYARSCASYCERRSWGTYCGDFPRQATDSASQAFVIEVLHCAFSLQESFMRAQTHLVARLRNPAIVNFAKLQDREHRGVPAKPRVLLDARVNGHKLEIELQPMLDADQAMPHYVPAASLWGDFIAAGDFNLRDAHVAPYDVLRLHWRDFMVHELESYRGVDDTLQEAGRQWLRRTLLKGLRRLLQALEQVAEVQLQDWVCWEESEHGPHESTPEERTYERLIRLAREEKNAREGRARTVAEMLAVRRLQSVQQYEALVREAADAGVPAPRFIGDKVGRKLTAGLLAKLDETIAQERKHQHAHEVLSALCEQHRPGGYPHKTAPY